MSEADTGNIQEKIGNEKSMWKRYLFLVIGAALMLPEYSSAIVASFTTPFALWNQEGAGAATNERTTNHELQLFRKAQISLYQAVIMAEELPPGSRTLDITFDGTSTSPTYRVKTVKLGQIWENFIDAQTGAIAGNEIVSMVNELSEGDRSNVIVLRTIHARLLDAVLAAERAAQGKAIGGRIISEDEKYNFVVSVVSDEGLEQVILEAPDAQHSAPTSPSSYRGQPMRIDASRTNR